MIMMTRLPSVALPVTSLLLSLAQVFEEGSGPLCPQAIHIQMLHPGPCRGRGERGPGQASGLCAGASCRRCPRPPSSTPTSHSQAGELRLLAGSDSPMSQRKGPGLLPQARVSPANALVLRSLLQQEGRTKVPAHSCCLGARRTGRSVEFSAGHEAGITVNPVPNTGS